MWHMAGVLGETQQNRLLSGVLRTCAGVTEHARSFVAVISGVEIPQCSSLLPLDCAIFSVGTTGGTEP